MQWPTEKGQKDKQWFSWDQSDLLVSESYYWCRIRTVLKRIYNVQKCSDEHTYYNKHQSRINEQLNIKVLTFHTIQ